MFQINCTNKGCYQMQAPFIDPDTNKVYCSICNNEIVNINDFVKRQLKASKQFRPKNKTPFAVKCFHCKTNVKPELVDDEVVCSLCFKKLDKLSQSFIIMLKMRLKSTNEDHE